METTRDADGETENGAHASSWKRWRGMDPKNWYTNLLGGKVDGMLLKPFLHPLAC